MERERVVIAACRNKHRGVIGQCPEIFGLQPKRGFRQPDCLGISSLLSAKRAEQLQRRGVLWLLLENLLVQACRLVQLSLLMKANGALNRKTHVHKDSDLLHCRVGHIVIHFQKCPARRVTGVYTKVQFCIAIFSRAGEGAAAS